MIDIEILTAMLKELGYLYDSQDEEKKEEHAKGVPIDVVPHGYMPEL